jgi:hypothetical protein
MEPSPSPATNKLEGWNRREPQVSLLRPGIRAIDPRWKPTLPFVIPRACDFFELLLFFAPDQMFFNALLKAVILSEAPRGSIT